MKSRIIAGAAAVVALLAVSVTAQANGSSESVASKAAVVQPGPNTVGTSELKDNGVTLYDIGDQAVWGVHIKDLTIPESKFGWDFRNKIQKTYDESAASKAASAQALAKANEALAKPDADSLAGAYYAVGVYDKGDTNAGAIATVACKKTTDKAVSGGVQVLGLDATANSRNTPVSSSFPGRMDWATNKPIAGRLDGWIVQFGGNAGTVSDKDPLKVNLYALCVPGADLPVVNTYVQSADD